MCTHQFASSLCSVLTEGRLFVLCFSLWEAYLCSVLIDLQLTNEKHAFISFVYALCGGQACAADPEHRCSLSKCRRTQSDWCSTVLHRVPAVGAFEVKESTVNDNAFMTKKRYFEGCDAASQRMITGLPVKCTHAKCRYDWLYFRKGMCSHGSATWAGITQLGRSLLLGCWTSLLVKYFFLFLYWGPFYARCVN
jgi:hypothetical protein